jgi:hypothetical protein
LRIIFSFFNLIIAQSLRRSIAHLAEEIKKITAKGLSTGSAACKENL